MHYSYATGGDPEKFKALLGAGVEFQLLEALLKARYR